MQYPAVTLRGLADVFPAMPHSDYQRFTLYFATIEEFAAKIPPRGEGATEDERKVAEVLFARDAPSGRWASTSASSQAWAGPSPPHVDFFQRHRREQLRRRRHGGVAHPGHSTSTPASAS